MPVVAGVPISRGLSGVEPRFRLRAALCLASWLMLLGLPGSVPAEQRSAQPAPRAILGRIWQGVEDTQRRHSAGCGTLTETRTSPLLTRPLTLQGTFCAAGIDRFRLEYAGTDAVLIVYNSGALNVSTDGGRHTEAFDVGRAVKRAQSYFSGPGAFQNLERDFSIEVEEARDHYVLRLAPISGRIARRVTRVMVELAKNDFLPSRIEIEGKSGVTSAFDIRVDTLDAAPDPSRFKVYRVRPPKSGHHDLVPDDEYRD